jgi:hypothetical protein
MPVPRQIIEDYLKKEMVTVMPDKYYHDCPERDDEDDMILEPEPYKPSRAAEEFSVWMHDYLIQWYGIADVIQGFGKTNFNNFMNGIKRVFDEWDHDR